MQRNPFYSFWMAGYECTDKLNCFGNRVDFLKVTGHLDMLEEDYQNLSFFDIKTVREGIRWSQVEKQPYRYEWDDVGKIINHSLENDIQVVWDICHFGFPDDLTPLHPMFAKRFSSLCSAFVKYYRSVDSINTLVVTPINEVSFLSWLGGDACGTAPYCKGYGWEVKYALMRAYIEGIEGMKEADDNVRILTTEPLTNMVPPLNATEAEIAHAAKIHNEQFQMLDILSGRICPELRGKPEYIDIIGCNYYYNNQWIVDSCECLPWANETNDPRWLPLRTLLKDLYDRYEAPIVLSETSHPGEHKPNWIQFIARECQSVINDGIPLWGICWYPIVDRPDWDHLEPWHKAGLWNIDKKDDGKLTRILDAPAANAFLDVQSSFKTNTFSHKVLI
jgi:hypothetical protein